MAEETKPEEKPKPLAVGDAVYFRCGGPKMIVTGTQKSVTSVTWWSDAKQQFDTAEVHPAALLLCDKQPPKV